MPYLQLDELLNAEEPELPRSVVGKLYKQKLQYLRMLLILISVSSRTAKLIQHYSDILRYRHNPDPGGIASISPDDVRALVVRHFSHWTARAFLESYFTHVLTEAYREAVDWVLVMLELSEVAGWERLSNTFKEAVKKSTSTPQGVWDTEQHCMMTFANDDQPDVGLRFHAGIAWAMEHLFRERQILDQAVIAAEAEARELRAKERDREAHETRRLMVRDLRESLVDHFACSVPLSQVRSPGSQSPLTDCCAICQESYTDFTVRPIATVHADYPVRIKFCGHVFGRSCLEKWLRTKNRNTARFPNQSCPICRTEIEGVRPPPLPESARRHFFTQRRGLEAMKLFTAVHGKRQEDVMTMLLRAFSKDVAAEELIGELQRQRAERGEALASEDEQSFFAGHVIQRDRVQWAMGFRGHRDWDRVRDDWVASGVVTGQ